MALPELIANSATPGTVVALTTLSAEATAEAVTIKTNAAAPVALQGTGQFHIVVGSEIMIVTGGAATTTWTVTRKAEGTTGAVHAVGVSVFQFLTAEALENLLEPTAWAAMASLGAKMEENIALQTLGVRNEVAATMTRLRGGLKVKAAETLAAGETVCTLPEGKRPLGLVKSVIRFKTVECCSLSIANTGIITLSQSVVAGAEVNLDGITFNHT